MSTRVLVCAYLKSVLGTGRLRSVFDPRRRAGSGLVRLAKTARPCFEGWILPQATVSTISAKKVTKIKSHIIAVIKTARNLNKYHNRAPQTAGRLTGLFFVEIV